MVILSTLEPPPAKCKNYIYIPCQPSTSSFSADGCRWRGMWNEYVAGVRRELWAGPLPWWDGHASFSCQVMTTPAREIAPGFFVPYYRNMQVMARLRGNDGHTATPDQVDPQAGRGSAPCPRRPRQTPSRRAGIGQPLRRSMVAWATGSGLSALPGSSSFDVWRRNILHLGRRKNRYRQIATRDRQALLPALLRHKIRRIIGGTKEAAGGRDRADDRD